jgi:hypothetical protein
MILVSVKFLSHLRKFLLPVMVTNVII